MKRKVLALALAVLLGSASPIWAADSVNEWVNAKATSEHYGEKFGGMFLRGLYRVVKAPVKLVYHTYDDTVHNTQYGLGILTGLGKGLLHGTDSLVRGVIDVVGSPLPRYHGISDGDRLICGETVIVEEG